MSAAEATLQIFASIGDKISKRLDFAHTEFNRVLRFEKKRRLLNTQKQDLSSPRVSRPPFGWLVDEKQSFALPLYSGGNLIDGIEIRLASGKVFCGGKSYSSNSAFECGGRRFLIKLLPPLYCAEGESL